VNALKVYNQKIKNHGIERERSSQELMEFQEVIFVGFDGHGHELDIIFQAGRSKLAGVLLMAPPIITSLSYCYDPCQNIGLQFPSCIISNML
jgi:hypothetical protein